MPQFADLSSRAGSANEPFAPTTFEKTAGPDATFARDAASSR
jgi:hypothetical protein